MLFEVRWHGRGGQGVWTASNILAMAAMYDGKYVQSFPAFGPERSGAPVLAFARISDEPIEVHSMVYNPDIVIVLDPTLLGPKVVEGLKRGGYVIANYDGPGDELYRRMGVRRGVYRVWSVPATKLALEMLKRPITNTAMIGALLRAVEIVSLKAVETALKNRFPERLAERNLELIKIARKLTREV